MGDLLNMYAKIRNRMDPVRLPRQRSAQADNVIPFRASERNVTADAEHPVATGLLTQHELWAAIHDNRVTMHYQPQYDVATGAASAAEALVRLLDLDGNLIFPDRFIEQAEECALIVDLGRVVIAQVCADLGRWRREGIELERISINLSALQLNVDEFLAEFVITTAEAHGLVPDDLEFELTERQHLDPDGVGMTTITALACAGSRIALDDFGVGYSSVAYLAQVPVSTLKLDRCLMSRVTEDERSALLVYNLLNLAADLGIEVVAEGIETIEQAEFLKDTTCRTGQGFLYARPMDASLVPAFLEEAAVI